MSDNHKRARSGELAPLSPRKKKEGFGLSHPNIYKEHPPRPMSPNEQMNLMLLIEREEAKVSGEPSAVDQEVQINFYQFTILIIKFNYLFI